MTITIPWRGTGIHRAAGSAELRDENRKLLERQAAADEFFGRLLADRDAVYDAWQTAKQHAAEAELVVVCQQAEIEELKEEAAALRAALANACAVSVPPAARDIDPDDRPTEPTGIHVKPIWDALGITPATA
ncbi:hypothetical protein [Streptomyces vilmorinianum]|uniref:hypothetical protein n=1 Tax=Streptomyces vilmorinianum TaxID=3051092 RepID=UPI0010FB93D9|nr:hypothetical protein [Streptomyces vilmorinianum]